VGAVDEYELNKFRLFEFGKLSVGVIHTDAGWFAVRNRCPHMLGELCKGIVTGTMLPSGPDELCWGLEGRVVRCPWHGWEYDLATGRSVFETNRTKVATYPVEVEDGRVTVTLPPRRPADDEEGE
jgi:nitrite reductase/ring-hydroxylating ferredoxin subunit